MHRLVLAHINCAEIRPTLKSDGAKRRVEGTSSVARSSPELLLVATKLGENASVGFIASFMSEARIRLHAVQGCPKPSWTKGQMHAPLCNAQNMPCKFVPQHNSPWIVPVMPHKAPRQGQCSSILQVM